MTERKLSAFSTLKSVYKPRLYALLTELELSGNMCRSLRENWGTNRTVTNQKKGCYIFDLLQNTVLFK